MVPVVASNRYGTEILLKEDGSERQRITFFGQSFITDANGSILEEVKDMENKQTKVIVAKVTPLQNKADRLAWGLFRDRRPDLYGLLLTKDGFM
jgi:N-carbamoylputrescine amidase